MNRRQHPLSHFGGLSLVCGLLVSVNASAQSDTLHADYAHTPGTFRLLTIEPKMREVFTTDLYPLIEAHRNMHENVLLRVGEVTWVRIFSRAVINAPDFVPASEEILVVDPANVGYGPHPR